MPFWVMRSASVDERSEKAQQVSPVPAKKAERGEATVFTVFRVAEMSFMSITSCCMFFSDRYVYVNKCHLARGKMADLTLNILTFLSRIN